MSSEELATIKELFADSPTSDQVPLEELRGQYDKLGSLLPPPDDVDIEAITIDHIPAEWIKPHNKSNDKVLMYVHGGGYCIGSLDSHRSMVCELAKAVQCQVLNVEYRLAPEHAYPAAVEDAAQCYQWLLDQGHKNSDIAIGGDSAGGGLTMATLLEIKKRNLPQAAAGICLSPWADLTLASESMTSKASEDPIVSKQGLQKMADDYLQGQDAKADQASSIFADLSGLPPILIHVGTAEVLLDDSKNLLEALESAGVKTTYKEWPDMLHVFQFFHIMLSEARESIKEIGEFIQEL